MARSTRNPAALAPALCLLVAAAACCAPRPPRDGADLIANPGFETDADGDRTPDCWEPRLTGGARADFALDTEAPHAGGACARIRATTPAGYAAWVACPEVAPLRRLRLSGWRRTDALDRGVTVLARAQDRQGRETGLFLQRLCQTPDWAPFEFEVRTDAHAATLRIELRLQGAAGTVWYDDVSLRDVGMAPLRPANHLPRLVPTPPDETAQLLAAAAAVSEEADWIILSYKGAPDRVDDPTARNGRCGRIGGGDPPYFQLKWRPEPRDVPPGLLYDLYGRFKIEKRGDQGPAFKCGVHDADARKYVQNELSWRAADSRDQQWSTFRVARFALHPGQTVFAGPVRNAANVPAIFVDHFFLVPADADATRFCADAASGAVRAYVSALGLGAAGLRLKPGAAVEVGLLLANDPRALPDTVAGIAVDYHANAGFAKRVLFCAGLRGEAVRDGAPLRLGWGRDAVDSVRPLPAPGGPGAYRRCRLPLAHHAPAGWDGEIWLSFVTRSTTATLSGLLVSPPRAEARFSDCRIARDDGDEVGFDASSLAPIRERVRLEHYRRLRLMQQ